LCDKKLGGTHAEAITDPDTSLKKPFSREALPERSPREIHPWKLSTPVFIVLERVGIYGLLRTAVHGEVGLLVHPQG